MGVSATVGFFGSAMMSPLIWMIGDALTRDKVSDREVGRVCRPEFPLSKNDSDDFGQLNVAHG
jgi:hypothetical protein